MGKNPFLQVLELEKKAVVYIYFIGRVKYYKYVTKIYKEVP
jgi:hypothetical protein